MSMGRVCTSSKGVFIDHFCPARIGYSPGFICLTSWVDYTVIRSKTFDGPIQNENRLCDQRSYVKLDSDWGRSKEG